MFFEFAIWRAHKCLHYFFLTIWCTICLLNCCFCLPFYHLCFFPQFCSCSFFSVALLLDRYFRRSPFLFTDGASRVFNFLFLQVTFFLSDIMLPSRNFFLSVTEVSQLPFTVILVTNFLSILISPFSQIDFIGFADIIVRGLPL